MALDKFLESMADAGPFASGVGLGLAFSLLHHKIYKSELRNEYRLLGQEAQRLREENQQLHEKMAEIYKNKNK